MNNENSNETLPALVLRLTKTNEKIARLKSEQEAMSLRLSQLIQQRDFYNDYLYILTNGAAGSQIQTGSQSRFQVVLEIVCGQPGIRGVEIWNKTVDLGVEIRRSYLYSILSKCVKTGKLRREGQKYFVV